MVRHDRGTTDRLVVEIERANGITQELFVKSTASRLRSRALSHLAGLAASEVRFYRELAHEVPLETPVCHVARLDGGRFVVALEALEPAGLRATDHACTRAEAEQVLSALAAMHARYWASPRFDTDLLWLVEATDRDIALGRRWARPLVSLGLRRCHDMIEPALAHALRDWAGRRPPSTGPHTLVHRDCHSGNLWFAPDGRPTVLDWQLVRAGTWADDIGYFLATALDPTDRSAWEAALLAGYRDALNTAGVEGPDESTTWDQYRRGTVAALEAMTVTLGVGGLMHDDAARTLVGRTAAAVRDLGSLE